MRGQLFAVVFLYFFSGTLNHFSHCSLLSLLLPPLPCLQYHKLKGFGRMNQPVFFKTFNMVFFKQEKRVIVHLCLRTRIEVLPRALLLIIFMPAETSDDCSAL